MQKSMVNAEDRNIRIVRTIQAPVEKIWDLWTQPNHITHWWGPNGFTSTIHEMDFREGGEWKLTLHAPDGTNFPNKSVFMEIIPLKKIVFEHFYPHFITTVLFRDKGGRTEIDWTMQFETAELRNTIVSAHKADEGQRQNLERLEAYLQKIIASK